MTRIEITYIDGLTDLILTKERVKQIGTHNIELLTDEFYDRINEPEYKQQLVQRITWDKYQLQFIGLEDYQLEMLLLAKTIRVIEHEIYEAKTLDVSRELAGGSDFVHTTYEFYDVNLDNYKYGLPPVTEYLKSDALAERFSFAEMNILRIVEKDGTSYDFNTMLSIKRTVAQAENASFVNTQSGGNIVTNSIIKEHYQLVFYLNSNDIIPFQNMLPLAHGDKVRAYYFTNSMGHAIKEPPDVTVEKIAGHDIWKASTMFIFNIKNFYSYG